MPAAVTLIEAHSLRATEDGFEVKIRLNWYRSLPLSCVEKVSLCIDGEEVPPEKISFSSSGSWYSLKAMAAKTGEYWYVQDSASLHVNLPGKVTPGSSHTIDAEVTLRAPYILVGPGKFLTMPTKYTTIMVAE